MPDPTISPENSAAEAIVDDTIIAEVVEAHETDDEFEDEYQDDVNAVPRPNLVIRHVLEHQLVAGQLLSTELLRAATELTTAVAEAPATFAGAIQDGDHFAAAWARTGTAIREVAGEAGGRVRTALTSYVGHQATLPVAFVGGAGQIAGSIASAQDTLADSVLDGAFAVATVAALGGDLRHALERNVRDTNATATAARGEITNSVKRAGQDIREAFGTDIEPLVAAINDSASVQAS